MWNNKRPSVVKMESRSSNDQTNKVSNYSKKKYNAVHSQKPKLGLSILQQHDEKLHYFIHKDKIVKEYDKEIELMQGKSEHLTTKLAVCEANNDPLASTIKNEIRDMMKAITQVERTKKDLVSGETENTYMLNVCNLVNDYYKLEEEEQKIFKENTIDVDSGLEQKLFEINLQKKVITDDYQRILDPMYISKHTLYDDRLMHCAKCDSSIPLSMNSGYAVCYACGATYSCIHQATDLSYKEAQELDYRAQFKQKSCL